MTPHDHEVTNRLTADLCRDPRVLIITGFGSGFLKPAPGTWGSVVALVLWWWLLAPLAWPLQLAVVVVVFAAATWLVDVTVRRYAVADDPTIVVDEFVGLWLALLAAPVDAGTALAGFLLFRVFDIWKPWPVGLADRRLAGGFGVMADDVVAGAMALGVLQFALWALAASGLAASA